jgi:hypothetical protein
MLVRDTVDSRSPMKYDPLSCCQPADDTVPPTILRNLKQPRKQITWSLLIQKETSAIWTIPFRSWTQY